MLLKNEWYFHVGTVVIQVATIGVMDGDKKILLSIIRFFGMEVLPRRTLNMSESSF